MKNYMDIYAVLAKNCEEYFDALVTAFEKHINYGAASYILRNSVETGRVTESSDDVRAHIIKTLRKAVEKYDHDNDGSFLTYARNFVYNEINLLCIKNSEDALHTDENQDMDKCSEECVR